ncbi:MAG: ATP-binding protein [Polyangiaceae bacterium]
MTTDPLLGPVAGTMDWSLHRIRRMPAPKPMLTPHSSGVHRLRGGDSFDSLPVACMIVSAAGRVERANPRAAEVLRQPLEALLGAEVGSVLAPIRDLAESALAGMEERTRRRLEVGGESFVVGFRASSLGPSGGFSVVFQDITHWDHVRKDRDRLMQLAGVSEVLPAILHELRNPLAAMAANLELMIEEPRERTAEDLHALLGEVRRALLTLDGLGSVDHQLHDRRNHAVDLAIREVCRVLTGQAKARGVTLHLEVEDMPLLPFKRAVVRAIAFNLITNALHAGRPGGQVWVSARVQEDEFQLEVRDDGEGMGPDVLARCKELFFTTKSKGTGIGLALCDRVVRNARGRLHVASETNRGTTVELDIPVSAPPSTDRPPPDVKVLPKE